MQVRHKPTKILIVGKSGSGKSTYEIRFLENADYAQVFIFDHKGEFEERCRIEPCFSAEEMLEKLEKGERVISYAYVQEWPGDSQSAFAWYCEWVYEICKVLREDGRKRLFACDEVNRFTTTAGGDKDWEFNQLVEDGRLQGLDLIATAHASNQVNNRLRLQLSEVVALKSIDPGPLKFLEDMGFDVERVKALQTGEFIVKNLDNDTFQEGKLFSGQGETESATPEKEAETGEQAPGSEEPQEQTEPATAEPQPTPE